MLNLRRLSQGFFLAAFLFLFLRTESSGRDALGWPVRIFLDFDPLILATTLLAAKSAARAFYWALATIAATLVLGRVFCGWVCPLGTLNNLAGMLNKKDRQGQRRNWRNLKYYLLVFLAISSLFGLQLTGVLDPISLTIRSLALSLYPAFNSAVRAFLGGLYDITPSSLANIPETVDTFLRDTVLAFRQPVFQQGIFIGVLFLAILGLNLVEKRFWCRYLCPLGALLGFLARFSLLKRSVGTACNECGACAEVCPGNASPHVKEGWLATECYYCWNCADICPQKAVRFGMAGKKHAAPLNLGRRRILAAAAIGAVAVPFFRSEPVAQARPLEALLIRPPGALPENEFLERCVKCGECMKVCITNGLQPTLFEAGLQGIWSPVLVPRLGYCEYRCTLCGRVCPTGAIRQLSLPEKAKVKIGLATVDKNRCLPWAHATPCIVCEEVCPTPRKAVWLEEAKVRDRQGELQSLKRPRVDISLCIGCGICEAKCPIVDKPAIAVTNINESRSEANGFLLP